MKDFETGLTAAQIRSDFDYDRHSGLLTRLWPVIAGRGGIMYPEGSIAGSLHKDGYVYIAIKGRLYMAHRLAWVHVTGEWPAGEIDHRNGVRNDNKWLNLRDASVTQNRQNTLGQKKRKGAYPGVYESSRDAGVFIAQIKHRGQVHYLGRFDSPELARQARIAAEQELFGEFAGSARGA